MSSFLKEFSGIKAKYETGENKHEKLLLKQKLLSRPIVLYGLGFFGGVIVKNFKQQDITIECFCDSRKTGVDAETGLQIITPAELCEKYSDANIVISVANPNNEKSVYNTVKSLNFSDEQIFPFKVAYQFIKKSRVELVSLPFEEIQKLSDGFEWAYDFFKDENSRKVILDIINGYLFNTTFSYDPPQDSYFPKELILNDSEIFVDGGIYTGDTTEDFIKRVNGKYKKIIGFDIDEKNLCLARTNLQKYSNIEIIPKGLWSCSEKQNAELGITAGSNIKEGASDVVELTSLDELFFGCPLQNLPTFVKLDVEGSEREALIGASNIIRAVSPKLAVCVYHKPKDVFDLTQLIYESNPNYKFCLKHYSPYVWDTVLYAYND
ncbi:MAG: FkbM family methyltransferase [Treponema sp.]|jgi:hypothetical protein|nr:FkbM family methyltransferase [Treponema sp.]